jgi:HK97 family phage prohead protease
VKEQATFQFDFALDADASVELEGKALRIEGYAAGFDRDREGEAFMPGVFDKGLEKYFKRNPVLCYHHHTDQALGVVEEAKLDGKGLFVKAKLDDPEPGTPLADVYNKVKSGTIKGFSVGGIFRRKMTPQGPRIHPRADGTRQSICLGG